MTAEATPAPASRTPYIALAVAAVFGVMALLTVPVVRHVHRRRETAISAREYGEALAASKRITLPSPFAPTHVVGTTPCPIRGLGPSSERCWFTPAEPQQVTAALVAAARAAGAPATLNGCVGSATRRGGARALLPPFESCAINASYGQWTLRISAHTNLVSSRRGLPIGAPITLAKARADGTNVILGVVPR